MHDNVVMVKFKRMLRNFIPPESVKKLIMVAMAIITANTDNTGMLSDRTPRMPMISNKNDIIVIIINMMAPNSVIFKIRIVLK